MGGGQRKVLRFVCQKKSKKLIILQLQPASGGYCLLVQIGTN